VRERLTDVSVPRRLEISAVVVFALVFLALLEFGRPGLGISQGFYLGIVLVALAGGPATGASAGVVATALCAFVGIAVRNDAVADLIEPLAVRLAAFTVAGAAVGYFAQRGRRLLAQSLRVLDDVLGIARRDVATGVLTWEGIGACIDARADRSWPFAVLVGDVRGPAASSDRALRETLRSVARWLDGEGEIGRVGEARVAVTASSLTPADAEARARELERAFGGAFGWAIHPQEGADPLSLFGIASERLQARRDELAEPVAARSLRLV
jgi:hypothetical protein